MIWTQLTEGIAAALRAAGWYSLERLARVELAIPRDPSHGDWTSNIAMHLSKELEQPPRRIAETLVEKFSCDPNVLAGGEIAGPGFINFRYAAAFLNGLPRRIVEEKNAA